ncbi:LacI family DNA-binding transcriptional regulator [Microlunatus soli]|uniref:Transcriptional regulator, LacI family n=1 Tax=Microlunatus soli TaxID=630515 RepID=A0A1H1TV56_9ACTN|nr:LacI family DNA-binding transcriptional regulator [Microlunatus soli]SDS63786.1 transcriptional regulator, LacI family [Microlunatus soli]
MANGRPTMRDIAAQAGVSPMSVSRALSGGSGVSEQTRAQVLATVEALGYQPNEFARQLRTGGPTHVIALVVTHLANPFYAELALGVERVAAAHGSRVMIMSTMADLDTEREVVTDLRRRPVDGVIIIPATPDHRHLAGLTDQGRPVVFATTPPNGIDADSVTVDDFGGMRSLCTRLLSVGHTRIGLIGLNHAMWTGSERHRGYAAAHAEAGLTIDSALIAERAGDIETASQATRRLLDLDDPPTAIIATNNQMTIGVLRAVRDVGSTAAVAGFDDLEVADLFQHPLTVVKYQAEQLGSRSAELLFNRLALRDEGPSQPAREMITTSIVRYR